MLKSVSSLGGPLVKTSRCFRLASTTVNRIAPVVSVTAYFCVLGDGQGPLWKGDPTICRHATIARNERHGFWYHLALSLAFAFCKSLRLLSVPHW